MSSAMSTAPRFVSFHQAIPPFFVGVDLGDTYLTAGVVDDEGHPLSAITDARRADQAPALALLQIRDVIAEAIKKAGVQRSAIVRCGLGLPGSVDIASGKLVEPDGLSQAWDGFPIREQLGTCQELPFGLFHNAIAAAYGEVWVGAARNLPSVTLLTLGPHIGCGVIFGDASIDGQSSYGIGSAHMIVNCDAGAPLCRCGQRGHLDAYICDAAILNRIRQLLAEGRTSTLARHIEQGHALTVESVAREAAAGDALAQDVVAEMARHLGVGIVNIMNTIDPDGVLLGGPTTFGGNETPLGRQFLQWVKEEVARRSFASLVEHTKIDFATLNGGGVYLGAAGLARLESIK
jgi:glucokinase